MLLKPELVTIKLTLALEAERFNPSSFWAPYIATLPTNYTSQPMFWLVKTINIRETPF